MGPALWQQRKTGSTKWSAYDTNKFRQVPSQHQCFSATTLLVSRLQCVGVELPRRAEHAHYPFVENHKFDSKQLGPMKQDCQPHCFSTLNHIVAYCYNDARVIRWLVKQALNRFQG